MGEVLPAEDNGPNLSEDATPQNENGMCAHKDMNT